MKKEEKTFCVISMFCVVGNSQNDEKLSDKEVKLSSLKSRNEDSTRTPSMTTGPATRSHCSSASTGSNETSTRPPKRLAASNAKNESGALARSCDSSGESGEKWMSHALKELN